METEEEDPKEEPVKEIKEVKGQGLLACGLSLSRLPGFTHN
jgi:hypothetical protein